MLGRMIRPGTRAAATAVLASVLGSLLLGGCVAGDPVAIGTSGVDGLEIPTPSADPDDFVGEIDNPWLPLRPGSEWVYESPSGDATTVTVTDETREIQGVTTTGVREVTGASDGPTAEETTRWYAQDAAGNVWLFGEDADGASSWEAGADGAEAGMAMPAAPRVGDGYRSALASGVAEDTVTVLSLDEAVNVEADSYADVLQTEVTNGLEPGVVVRRYYARGTGLVFEESVGGLDPRELVEFTAG